MKKRLLKSKILLAYLLAAIFGVGTLTQAAGSNYVIMDSKLSVQNATVDPNSSYAPSINAEPGQVARFSVWYHNTENETSGKNAENLRIKISIPNVIGKTHAATSTVVGSNTNTVTSIATVNTSVDTSIEPIAGYTYRRYNKGTNASPSWVTEKISDVVYGNGYVIVSMKPCWNFQETITVQARVRAVPQAAPTCIISASPNTVERGTSAVLNFSSTNATSATISGIGSVSTSGSRTVTPNTTTNYNMTVTGPGGSANCSTTVTVTDVPNAPVCAITATPSSIRRGDSSTLNFTSQNATSASISGIGSVALNGSRNVTPNESTVYTMTVTGPGGTRNCSATVTVNDVPIIPNEPEVPQTPTQVQRQSQTQTQYVSQSTAKGNTPETGPAEAAAGAAGITASGGAAWAWLRSKKALLSAITKIK